ncbi:MAG: tetratricopeptide repeat protein [Planctomycetota bacterium]|nr:tetratricopeptide repeat protein [Planctomycetota bacterium]MDE2216213.1 tetratricopeptide repeat protein [Planctomycetota bacterium]
MESENRFLNSITLPNYEFIINSPEFKKEGAEFTIWFFENIIEKNPNYVDCLMYLGNVYTANGMYEKGLMVDQKLSLLRPKDPMVHYNLACSYALLKKIDAAFDALEKAIALGYKDVYHLEMDKDLTYLRKDIRYKKLIRKIKNY